MFFVFCYEFYILKKKLEKYKDDVLMFNNK